MKIEAATIRKAKVPSTPIITFITHLSEKAGINTES
jgi:hypothetical protein